MRETCLALLVYAGFAVGVLCLAQYVLGCAGQHPAIDVALGHVEIKDDAGPRCEPWTGRVWVAEPKKLGILNDELGTISCADPKFADYLCLSLDDFNHMASRCLQ